MQVGVPVYLGLGSFALLLTILGLALPCATAGDDDNNLSFTPFSVKGELDGKSFSFKLTDYMEANGCSKSGVQGMQATGILACLSAVAVTALACVQMFHTKEPVMQHTPLKAVAGFGALMAMVAGPLAVEFAKGKFTSDCKASGDFAIMKVAAAGPLLIVSGLVMLGVLVAAFVSNDEDDGASADYTLQA